MAVQIQFTANAYAVYPAQISIPKWFSEPYYHGTIDYYAPSPANYPADVAVAGPWAYLSVSPVGQVVEQVPDILTDVPGFLGHQAFPVASDLVRTKRKNVLHYRNGEFRPILCSPRLCLIERPMGESEE